MSSECPHLKSAVRPLVPRDLNQLITNPQCDVCEKRIKNLWLCLYPDCYMLGCSEEAFDHSKEHYNSHHEHVIQLNIHSRRAWCYACQREVSATQLVIGGIEAVEKFGRVLKPKPSDHFIAKPPVEKEQDERRHKKHRHVGGLVGLSNLGNTCYMNAALQCLSNVPALTEFFLRCPTLVHHSNSVTKSQGWDRQSLAKAYLQHVTDIWKTHRKTEGHYISPSRVSYAFKMAHPMFKGFHQHDSQEFLRCFMDQMHEELMEPALMNVDEEMDSVSETDSVNDETKSQHSSEDQQGEEQEYETADSGVSEQSSSNGDALRPRKRKFLATLDGAEKMPPLAEPHRRTVSLSDSEIRKTQDNRELVETESNSQSPSSKKLLGENGSPHFTLQKRHQYSYRSIISDIFDGKLVSSVQCLTCNRVSTTTETFQDLSLPIPSQDALSGIRSQSLNSLNSASNSSLADSADEGWLSWVWSWFSGFFYGPNITLEDCLAYFFSADELKGDNMYSCEKCKKLRNGLKFSRVTVLPDTLCIHLKRFRHEFAFSSKVSTKVTFPLVDLDMSPWLHSDCISKESTYDLIGVICHHGTAGGGHYTSYALNPVNNMWYEFDDSCVTQVEDACVLNAEAYVLFYRKVNESNEPIRSEVHRLLQESESHPSLLQYYVSRQWLNKFENFAEPGPIDNSDFLCRHGGVIPQKSEYVYDLCVAFPQSVWDLLYAEFGGGPACIRLYECSQCRKELDELTRQKKFELDEFKRLHDEFQNQSTQTSVVYCLSTTWFKKWEGFVTNQLRDPPGPIDNRGIVSSGVTRSATGSAVNQQTLRHSSDFIRLSEGMWNLFYSVYGGGPEVILRPNGSSQVTYGRGLMALSSRLRAKSLSEIATSGHGSSSSLTSSSFQ